MKRNQEAIDGVPDTDRDFSRCAGSTSGGPEFENVVGFQRSRSTMFVALGDGSVNPVDKSQADCHFCLT